MATGTFARDIERAIREVILGTNLTPRTTQSANLVGATSVTVADVSHFAIGGMVYWPDNLGEEDLPIAAIDATAKTLTLDFAGLPYSGLQYAHANGATVATNLCDYAPIEFGPMLAGGDPLIFAIVTGGERGIVAMRQTGDPLTVHIQWNASEAQRGASMHPNLWARRQQSTCKAGLTTIMNALADNPHLVTSKPAVARRPGRDGSAVSFRMTWDRLVVDQDLPIFAGAVTFTVVTAQRTMVLG